MSIPDYQLTIRDKQGQVIATMHHPDRNAAAQSLNHLAAEMHTRPEAKASNMAGMSFAVHGFLWATDRDEENPVGTYSIELMS